MNNKLALAMSAEMNIWKLCYANSELPDGSQCFYYPDYPSHPHWNIAYPNISGNIFPDLSQLEEMRKFFKSKNVIGHYYSEDSTATNVISVDEYFEYRQIAQPGNSEIIGAEWRLTENLELFSEIVCQGFEIYGNGRAQFEDKMQKIKVATLSFFYILYFEDKPIGAVSLFEGLPNFLFVMNLCILKKHRGHGLAHTTHSLLKEFSGFSLLTHSNNPILMHNLLPKSNWVSIGKVYVRKI